MDKKLEELKWQQKELSKKIRALEREKDITTEHFVVCRSRKGIDLKYIPARNMQSKVLLRVGGGTEDGQYEFMSGKVQSMIAELEQLINKIKAR